MIASNDSDESFIRALTASIRHVEHVAAWLRTFGKTVVVNPVKIRDKRENWQAFSDNGDLIVDGRRVEVKERNFWFESREQFRLPTIIVDEANFWDRAAEKPFAYVLTNRQWSACFVVMGSTQAEWTRKTRYDRYKHRDREFYECPIGLARFFRMPAQAETSPVPSPPRSSSE